MLWQLRGRTGPQLIKDTLWSSFVSFFPFCGAAKGSNSRLCQLSVWVALLWFYVSDPSPTSASKCGLLNLAFFKRVCVCVFVTRGTPTTAASCTWALGGAEQQGKCVTSCKTSHAMNVKLWAPVTKTNGFQSVQCLTPFLNESPFQFSPLCNLTGEVCLLKWSHCYLTALCSRLETWMQLYFFTLNVVGYISIKFSSKTCSRVLLSYSRVLQSAGRTKIISWH